MSLKDNEWKCVYRSGDQNLLKEFYAPVLQHAVQYDRAVGYFSTDVLIMNLQGITSLVRNGGHMRLVIGHPLDEDEFIALKHGRELSKLLVSLNKKLLEVIEDSKNKPVNRLELLAYLIAAKKLEIKYALRRVGMYHEKIGIVHDSENNIVVFNGSANETVYALDEGYNSESITVFTSWRESFNDYGKPFIEGFENLWQNKQQNTQVIDMPSSHYEEIARLLKSHSPINVNFEEIDNSRFESYFNEDFSEATPKIPSYLNGSPFELGEHQKLAIQKWWANQNKGILKLATGSGKTVTAIVAATKLYEARKRLVLIVSVPYVELAIQWIKILKLFNIKPIKCWDSKALWEEDLDSEIISYRMNSISFLAIVVVNKTLSNGFFSDKIKKIDGNEIMYIGDECHNLGSNKISESLPDAYFRLGLSATPFRGDDDEIDSPFPNDAKNNILKYFDRIVSEYSLEDAINDRVLCEYNYYIVPVNLTLEEQEEFDRFSSEIGRLLAIRKNTGLDDKQKSNLTSLCGQRSMLLGSAEGKFTSLEEIIKKFPLDQRKHSLFYCGAGSAGEEGKEERVVEKVSKILTEHNWRSSRFTSIEKSKARMNEFVSGVIDALVSIRVLDEGVDVPLCNKAFILASTKNPRQYVQRRGRVLRKAVGKDKAEIYDFVVLPAIGCDSPFAKALIDSELERVEDFCLLATNKLQVESSMKKIGLK